MISLGYIQEVDTTPGTIKDKIYLYSDKSSNYQHGLELGLSQKALEGFKYALYEVEFEIEIDKETGKVKIISAKCEGQ